MVSKVMFGLDKVTVAQNHDVEHGKLKDTLKAFDGFKNKQKSF